MEEAVENMRPHFDALLTVRNENGQGLTQQGMANRLNADGVLSLTGQPWSKYSVRRILKKLNMQTEISASQSKNDPTTGDATIAAGEYRERDLDENSPLRQWSYYESIRGVIEELTAKPYTVQDLARQLNERGVATTDGAPWNESAVARALRTLKPSDSSVQSSEDEIRNRIKQGWYDTASERFIAVPAEKKAGKKRQEKTDSKPEKKPKKEKKTKKGNSGKGKKK